MPVYAQIVLLIIAFFIFVFLIMYLSGLGIRRLCFKIIEEMEEKNAFNVAKAVKLQEKRRNIFYVVQDIGKSMIVFYCRTYLRKGKKPWKM